MKEIKINEIKEIQLEMLKYVKKVCEENNLKYYLCGGTLLGAIRHKGYIPWDDDIDILMPIDDYKKFLNIQHEDKGYSLLNPYSYDNYYYVFSKLVDKRTKLVEFNYPEIEEMGVYIDIFPLFALPNDSKEQKEFVENILNLYNKNFKYYRTSWYYSENKFKMVAKAILKFPLYIYNKRKNITENILKLMEKYNYEESDYVGFLLTRYPSEKEITRKEVYRDTVDVEFEGEIFSAAIGYEEYLTSLYGDYMKLPPVEKQVSHHNFNAYWREQCMSLLNL